MKFVFLLHPNPKLLVPLYIELLASLGLVLLESIRLSVHAIHVPLLLEYTLSLSFLLLFALRSPIVVLSSASLAPFDTLFYIHLVFVVLLSTLSFVSFAVLTLVHFVLFVVLLPFLFLFSLLFTRISLFIDFLLSSLLDLHLVIFVDRLVVVLPLQIFALSMSTQLIRSLPPTKPFRLQLHTSFHLYTRFAQML